jgi:hypothetical protein
MNTHNKKAKEIVFECNNVSNELEGLNSGLFMAKINCFHQ